MSRVHEASIGLMKQLAEIQDRKCQEINSVNYSSCKRCGSMHSHQKEKCPAWNTTCSECGRRNHCAKVYNKRLGRKGKCPQTHITQNRHKFKPGYRETDGDQQYRYQGKKRSNHVYSLKACQSDDLYEQFAQMIIAK